MNTITNTNPAVDLNNLRDEKIKIEMLIKQTQAELDKELEVLKSLDPSLIPTNAQGVYNSIISGSLNNIDIDSALKILEEEQNKIQSELNQLIEESKALTSNN